jgi:tagatose 1,6-diphosphate aldolase
MGFMSVLETLGEEPESHGLFRDVGELRDGDVRLHFDGHKFDPARRLPLYLFNVENAQGEQIGQYHFTPGAPEVVGDKGNSGGFMHPPFKRKGYSRSTIKALAPLAKRHGLDSIIITCPSGNVEAREAIAAIGGQLTNPGADVYRFQVPLN